jgi:hypothetical protein
MEGMSEAQQALLIQQTVGLVYMVVGGLALFFFLLHRDEQGRTRWSKLREHFFGPRTVKHSDDRTARYYDEPRPSAPRSVSSSSVPWREEVQEEEGGEVWGPPPGSVVITEKALQDQGREAYEQGAIDAFAALVKGGWIDPAKKPSMGKLKTTVHQLAQKHTKIFGATGGGSFQRFNELLEAAAVEEPPPPPAPAPRLSPVAGRELPADAKFHDEKPAGVR